METKFNFKSAICTSRFQSERLLALGLKPETADMSSDGWNDPVVSWGMEWSKEVIESGRLPAWSLHRLLMMTTSKRKVLLIRCESDLFDAVIKRIERDIKEGYFNKEYLV